MSYRYQCFEVDGSKLGCNRCSPVFKKALFMSFCLVLYQFIMLSAIKQSTRPIAASTLVPRELQYSPTVRPAAHYQQVP